MSAQVGRANIPQVDGGPERAPADEPHATEASGQAVESDRSLSTLVPVLGVLVAVFIVVGSLIDLHVW